MEDNTTNGFSMRTLLLAVTVIAIGIVLVAHLGPLSAMVATLAMLAFVAVCFRYLAGWTTYSLRKRILAAAMTLLCGSIIFVFSAALWLHKQVQSNRLSVIYTSQTGARGLRVSVFHGKGTFVTVSGSLPTRESFSELRSEIFDDFANDARLGILWQVTAEGEKIDGSDRELFPDDYDSYNRRKSL